MSSLARECEVAAQRARSMRIRNFRYVLEGDVVVVGNVADEPDGNGVRHRPTPPPDGGSRDVAYEVLCRQHHRRRLTAARAKAVSLAPEPLPFG